MSAQVRQLGKYELLEEIGEGGMGRVYRARHSLIGSDAAVKVLRRKLSSDREVVNRFFNEARATTSVRHPGIVSIYDFGFGDDGRAYIVMELLHGIGLGDLIRQRGTLSEEAVYRYTHQASGVLAAAHAAGIVHRDLKPDNLFVVPDQAVVGGERIKVLDFGIAKLSGDIAQNVSKTATGAVLGSPLYMSPEQCEGSGKTTAQSDLYSLGCVMFEMCVGHPPFGGNGVGAVIAKHIYEKPIPPNTINPKISVGLSELVVKLLEKTPSKRPASMTAVATEIDRLSDGATVSTQPRVHYANTPASTRPPRVGSAQGRLQDTTHGASSGQMHIVREPARSRVGLVVVAIAGLAAAAAAAVILSQRGAANTDESVSAAQPVEQVAAPGETDVAAQPSTQRDPDRDRDRAIADDDGAIEVIDTVSFTLTSEPEGALVRDAERRLLGETPFSTTVDRGAKGVAFVITQLGFEDTTVNLVPDEDRAKHVDLVAKAQTAAATGSSKTSSSKTSSSKTSSSKTSSSKNSKKKKKKPTSTIKKKKRKSGFGETIDPLAD